MGWGQALEIGGMAEQDISAFLAAGYTTEEAINAIKRARPLVEEGYSKAEGRYAPYAQMGLEAYQRLQSDVMGGKFFSQLGKSPDYVDTQFEYKEDPAYQARLQQGLRGLQASAASRGSQLSGETLKSLVKYAGQEAAKEYGAAYQRYQQDRGVRRGMYESDRASEAQRYGMNAMQNEYEYNRLKDIGMMGPRMATNLANIDLGRYGSLANLEMQMGNVKAKGYQAAADAAAQQGQHLQEIGGGSFGGGSSSSSSSSYGDLTGKEGKLGGYEMVGGGEMGVDSGSMDAAAASGTMSA